MRDRAPGPEACRLVIRSVTSSTRSLTLFIVERLAPVAQQCRFEVSVISLLVR
jgi:hypothetical protein